LEALTLSKHLFSIWQISLHVLHHQLHSLFLAGFLAQQLRRSGRSEEILHKNYIATQAVHHHVHHHLVDILCP